MYITKGVFLYGCVLCGNVIFSSQEELKDMFFKCGTCTGATLHQRIYLEKILMSSKHREVVCYVREESERGTI